MCYNEHMDITIRNLDEVAYREIKARSALEGKTVGQVVNEAIRVYLARPFPYPRNRTLRELAPIRFPDGNERLSEEIDEIVYGASKPDTGP